MALVNRSFSVNVTPGMMPLIVHVSEYDVGRAYTVSILDEQGNTFTIPSGTTASIEGTLNGSVGFTQSATVSNNQVSFTLSESMTAYSGKAWCKIKLTQNSQPIQTCAFVLAVDRAGVEADTILHSPGFQEQINEGVAAYFDNDPPFFELPSGGQSGQALLSDGADGAYWGDVQSGGTGLSDDAKAALLACFRNVAWIGSDGQDYYDDLYDALYPPAPPATLLSISASFNQGSAVIYDTDSLVTLKQYLTVTATYDDSSTGAITNYTLSGTLMVGTSTITVSYGGKTTTFNVTVTARGDYQPVEYVETDGASRIDTGVVFDATKDIEVTLEMSFVGTMNNGESALNGWSAGGAVGAVYVQPIVFWSDGASLPSSDTNLTGADLMTEVVMTIHAGISSNTVSVFTNENGTKTLARTHQNVANRTFLPFPLFALSTQSDFTFLHAGFRIKRAAIKVGGTTVRDMAACYRISDGEIGFHDSINDVFYSNEGTGTFLKGSDIA